MFLLSLCLRDYTGRFTVNAKAGVYFTQGDLSGPISIVNTTNSW